GGCRAAARSSERLAEIGSFNLSHPVVAARSMRPDEGVPGPANALPPAELVRLASFPFQQGQAFSTPRVLRGVDARVAHECLDEEWVIVHLGSCGVEVRIGLSGLHDGCGSPSRPVKSR